MATANRPAPEAPERFEGAPRIWALGGGKGGVGKSVVATSLAAAIAGTGRRCAVIDADLGGANLHTLLGVPRPKHTLSHFLNGDVKRLDDLLVPTSVPNLSLVSGNEALLEMANPKHCQKEKLFRHIRGLDVDEVLVDLGAGSAFNALDSFLIAARGVVVISPEPTAIENAEHFLRAAFYRSLRAVTRRPEVKKAIQRLKERRTRPVASARDLIAGVKRLDPPAAKLLQECADAFAPLLVVNQVGSAEHRRVGPALAKRCRDRFGIAAEFAGSLDGDANVRQAVARQGSVVQLFSRSAFTRQVEDLARRLLRDDWERPNTRSHRHLPPLDLANPGAYLRQCRQRRGLTLEELVERTRIQSLVDIERERFEKLPPEPYLKGFVLEYARELGIRELEALTDAYLCRFRGSAER